MFIYLEMPRFKKREDELLTHFDKWMYVLKNLPKLQERPVKLQEKVFEKLFSEAELAKLTPEDMRTYEESLKVYRDNKNAMDYAIEIATEAARQEGIQKGRQEGKQEGILLVAKELKRNGLPIDLIEKSTGLTKEQIEKL